MIYLVATLTAFFGLVVFRIGKQIYLTYKCIPTQMLRDFWFGKLEKGDKNYRRVVTHLGHCEECRDRLHQIQKGKPIEDHLIADDFE